MKELLPSTSEWTYGIVRHPKSGFCIMEVTNYDSDYLFSGIYSDDFRLKDVDYMLTILRESLKHSHIYQVDNDWKLLNLDELQQ